MILIIYKMKLNYVSILKKIVKYYIELKIHVMSGKSGIKKQNYIITIINFIFI